MGCRTARLLIAAGWINPDDYARALAEQGGLPFHAGRISEIARPADLSANLKGALAEGLVREPNRGFLFAPERLRPADLPRIEERVGPAALALASPTKVRSAICRHFAPQLTRAAVDGLHARNPEQSARTRMAAWQIYAFAAAATLLSAGLLLDPIASIRAVSYLLVLVFVPVISLRLVALWDIAFRKDAVAATRPEPRIPDHELPIYTVLVALYREAKVLPALVHGLTTLDYPAAKLDIKLVLEASDTDTIAAAEGLALTGNVELVIVPESHPRTKPKALNYALPIARGEYLVIFDAEDRPERDQLRKALAAFRDGPPNLACVQGRLNLYNARETWLTRQFTIEYSALFDGLLPTLDRLRLPFPLGGTSNHFRISALRWLAAWDPFNVTEDADLGTRLARNGYLCRTISSTTYEEAPVRLGTWIRQRTRWLKGYIQTWFVHMRDPARLWRELGPGGFTAFQVMIGGTVLSALVHPWFYALVLLDIATGVVGDAPESALGAVLWTMALSNLAAGYAAGLGMGYFAARKRGYAFLVREVPLMPIYWLLVSAAAYRALAQFITAPFKWEKTEHGLTHPAVSA